MVLTGRELADLLAPELGIAINPGAGLGLPLNPEGVRRLRGGAVPTGTRMRLGAPADEPTDLLAALGASFSAIPAVLEARRALAQIGEQAPIMLIGVHADQRIGTWQDDILAAVRTVTARTPIPYPVDTVFLDRDDEPVAAWMLRNTDPFYRRTTA